MFQVSAIFKYFFGKFELLAISFFLSFDSNCLG
mgnify:CR=1 FL=1